MIPALTSALVLLPAMYNDETIIESMTDIGYSLEDARNYVAIGCVEPTAPGKTLASTDAAMYNMPLAECSLMKVVSLVLKANWC